MADDEQARTYDAFISYSHRPDVRLAERLQRDIALVGRPAYRRARRRVFRDATEMAFSSDLRAALEAALRDSRWLVVIASEGSVESAWVRAEVALWRAERTPDRMIVVDVDGAARAHDWLTGGVPAGQILASDGDLAVRVAALLDAVPADRIGAAAARLRRTRALAFSTVAAVVVLAFVVAVTAAVVTRRFASSAERNRRLAVSSALAVRSEAVQQTDPQLAGLLAVAAYDLHDSPRTEHALAHAAQEQSAIPPYVDVALPATPASGAAVGDGFLTGAPDGTLMFWRPGTSARTIGKLPARLASIAGPLAVDVRGHVVAVDDAGQARDRGAVAVSADVTGAATIGRTLVLGCADGTVLTLDANSLAVRSRLANEKVIGIRADARTGMVVFAGGDKTVSGWKLDQARGTLTRRWRTPNRWDDKLPQRITGLAVAGDHDVLAVAGADGRIRMLRLSTGAVLGVPNEDLVPWHGEGVDVKVGWWPEAESFFSAGADRMLRESDPATGLESGRLGHSTLPGTATGFVGDRRGLLILLDHDAMQWLADPPERLGVADLAPVITADAGEPKINGDVVYAQELLGVSPRDGVVYRAMTTEASGGRVRAVTFRPGATTPGAAMDLSGPAALLPGAEQIALAHPDGTITLHDLRTGREAGRMATKHAVRTMRSAQGPTGWILAVADGTTPRVTVFHQGGGRPATLDTGRAAPIVDLAVLPTGRVATMDGTGAVDVFHAGTGGRSGSLAAAGPGRLLPVDGRDQFALAAPSGRVRLLDGATLDDRGTLTATAGDIVGVADDGDALVVAGTNSGIALHDPVTLAPRTPPARRGSVRIVGLARIGGGQYVAYQDGGLVEVHWDPAALRAGICGWVGRTPTPAETRRFGLTEEIPCQR